MPPHQVSLYIYCESVAVGILGEDMAYDSDPTPWLYASICMLVQLTLSAGLAFTFVEDTGVSIRVIMRGHAPKHITMVFTLSLSASSISLLMFSGREFAGEGQHSLYRCLYNIFCALWALAWNAVVFAHSSWKKKIPNRGTPATVPRDIVSSEVDPHMPPVGVV